MNQFKSSEGSEVRRYHSHQSCAALSSSYWFISWTDSTAVECEPSQTWLSMTSGSRVCLRGTVVLWLVSVEKMSICILFWLPGWWLLFLWLRFNCNKHLTDLTPDMSPLQKGFSMFIDYQFSSNIPHNKLMWTCACVAAHVSVFILWVWVYFRHVWGVVYLNVSESESKRDSEWICVFVVLYLVEFQCDWILSVLGFTFFFFFSLHTEKKQSIHLSLQQTCPDNLINSQTTHCIELFTSNVPCILLYTRC